MTAQEKRKALDYLYPSGVSMNHDTGEILRVPGGEIPDEATLTAALASAVDAERVAAIKAEANRRILAAYPEWKQRNFTARALELIELRDSGQALTGDEQSELSAIKSVWVNVKALRTYSDQLESDPSGDASGNIGEGWPEL